jgi:hypothetical protein
MTTIQIGIKKMEDLRFNLNGLVIQKITDGNSVLNGVAIVRLYTIFIPNSYCNPLRPTINAIVYKNNVVFDGRHTKYIWVVVSPGSQWNLQLDGRGAANPNNQEI